jgi:hypothetical protein
MTLDVVTHEVADTAMAMSTALALVVDSRLLPILIFDRTPNSPALSAAKQANR